MAQTITTPICSASPANGGSCAYTLGTSGGVSGMSGAFQNYTYTATPNPGWRFMRFEVSFDAVDSITGTQHYSLNKTDNPYTTETTADLLQFDGSAWWFYYELAPGIYDEQNIANLSVVAVFEPRNSGALIYSENQNGQLVYSGSQGGALVYDGDFAGNNSGTT